MISTTDNTCNSNSLVSSLLNNDTESSNKLKLIEFQPMNDDVNSQQKLGSSHLKNVPRTVSPTKGVERKSKRQRRTTSFYFEESLMMPSSRQSKFFQRPLPQATSSQMIWNQRLQQIQSVDGEPLVELKSRFSIHRKEVSSKIRSGEENDSLDQPNRTITCLNISDSDIRNGVIPSRKSNRVLHRQSTISLKRSNELPIVTKTRQLPRENLNLPNKNTSFSVPVTTSLHKDSQSLTTINPTNKLQSVTNTRRSSRIKEKRPRVFLVPTSNKPLERVKKSPKSFAVPAKSGKQNSTTMIENVKMEQSNEPNAQQLKGVSFEAKADTAAATRSSQRILNIRKQTDKENQISAENQTDQVCKTLTINTVASRKENVIENGESTNESTPGAAVHKQTRFFKDGWKVAGDPFPEERVCTGGYNVSFSVLLDRYDRNVKQGKCESVIFGPTIDSAKIAIASTMKVLLARGIDESTPHAAEALLDDGHRVHKRSIAAFEDQERLERAREKESDFWAARRYNSKTHKKTKTDAEMIKIAKSPIVFEDDRQRRRCFSVCQNPCAICHGSIESDLDPINLAHSLMPLYRPSNLDLTLESARSDGDNEITVRRRRSSGVSEKGIQTFLALKELSNTLEFIENYYAGYPKWGVTLQQS